MPLRLPLGCFMACRRSAKSKGELSACGGEGGPPALTPSALLRLCFPLVLSMLSGVNGTKEHFPAIISKAWGGRS